MDQVIPVVLFTHARTTHLLRVLDSLRENRVPLLYVYSDGARRVGEASAVEEVRALVRAIDWCEVQLVERSENWGLGRSILSGVTEVAAQHKAFIVFEDDLICVPGTYDWVCAALRHYASDERVMSVTAWTHPRLVPSNVRETLYFDGRAEGWVWGTWARCWAGMDESVKIKQAACIARGMAPNIYGSDLPLMAAVEQVKNIWAVRWCYHHLQQNGWCVRPPWSMVEHIGFDRSAMNAANDGIWANPPLRAAPPIPRLWPEPELNPQCSELWRKACPSPLRRKFNSLLGRLARFRCV